jgi:hypothetical protein
MQRRNFGRGFGVTTRVNRFTYTGRAYLGSDGGGDLPVAAVYLLQEPRN